MRVVQWALNKMGSRKSGIKPASALIIDPRLMRRLKDLLTSLKRLMPMENKTMLLWRMDTNSPVKII